MCAHLFDFVGLPCNRDGVPSQSEDCVFCKIIAGSASSSVVYRDTGVIAFMDIEPVNPGHVLVVPLRHAPHLADLDPSVGGRMFEIAQRIAAALKRSAAIR